MADKKVSTPTPSGISITRSGTKFTAKWSKPNGDKIKKQKTYWTVYTKDGKSKNYGVTEHGKTTTSDSWTFPASKYCPNAGYSDAAMVKKIRLTVVNLGLSNSTGDKSAYVEYALKAPKKPKIAFERANTNLNCVITAEDKDANWCTGILHVGLYVKSVVQASGSGSAVGPFVNMIGCGVNATKTNALSHTYRNFNGSDLDPAIPRYFYASANAIGPFGMSEKVESKRYVSKPAKATGTSVKRVAVGSYNVKWKYNSKNAHPADSFEIQHADVDFDKAVSDVESWSVAKSGISGCGAGKVNSYNVNTNLLGAVPENKKRYISIVASHDDVTTRSVTADSHDYGDLSDPGAVTLVWHDPSSVTTSRLAVGWETKLAGVSAHITIERDGGGKYEFDANGNAESYVTPTSGGTFDKSKKYRAYVQFQYKTDGKVRAKSKSRHSAWTAPVVCGLTGLSVTAIDSTTVGLSWTNIGESIVDGVNVAWSENEDAFYSNEQPETQDFDGTLIENIGKMASAVIRGLEKGKRYFFWVRRHGTADGQSVKSAWERADNSTSAGDEGVLLASPLTNVNIALARTWVKRDKPTVAAAWNWVAEDDEDAPTGSNVLLYAHGGPYDNAHALRSWSFFGTKDSAEIELRDTKGSVLPNGTYDVAVTVTNRFGATSSIRTEDGQLGGFQEVSVVGDPMAALSVQAGDGTPQWFETVAHEVTDEEAAEGAVPWTENVLRLPNPSFACESSDGTQMTLSIRSRANYELSMPYGHERVFEGEVVWSSDVAGAITSTAGAWLLDGGLYEAVLVATDIASGLKSAEATIPFTVDWTRKSEAPSAEVSVDGLSTVVTPTMAAGSVDGDACELYRLTPDGPMLMADNAEWGVQYVDRYAPYEWDGCAVRVACKTPYGSYAWEDFGYELPFLDVRIDWPGGYVELPYNLVMDDSRSKDYEVRGYLGGQRRAFVNPAITRRQSISSDMIVSEDDEKVPPLMALSRYAGTAMVRTPNGDAYVAVVDVSLSRTYESRKVAVTLDATETDPNGEYMAEKAEG